MEKQIIKEIESIPLSTLKKDDVLVIKIDCGMMPKIKAEEYMLKVRESVRDFVDNKVLVFDKGVDISVIRKEVNES